MYTTYLYTFFYTTYLYTFRSEFIIFLIIGHTCSIFICCSCRAYKLHFVWAGTPYSNNCCYWRSCFGWWPRIGSFMWSPHMWCCLYLEHYQISTFLWDNYFLVFWIFKCIPTLLCAGENAVLGMPETGLAIIPGYVIM